MAVNLEVSLILPTGEVVQKILTFNSASSVNLEKIKVKLGDPIPLSNDVRILLKEPNASTFHPCKTDKVRTHFLLFRFSSSLELNFTNFNFSDFLLLIF
jgi:hypothetical protein